ncbi:MAG TPA: heavy metal-binding domain-containing protein [Bacteroidia bacterium]
MNCSPNISIALILLSLTAGVWFLHKTQKDNLSILYKVAAWFVIIVSLLNMACCGMRCMMHCGKGRGECKMERGMRGGECERGEGCTMNMRDCNVWMDGKCNQSEDCKAACEDEDDNCKAACDKDDDDSKCCDKDKEECKMKAGNAKCEKKEGAKMYTCSMCGGSFDKVGKCPKCKMDLVEKK